MAYAEWIAVKVVVSKSIGTVGIRNATLQWGKFYRYTNKDDEISTEEVSSMNVQAGSPQWIASCGRENASSGTQGSFDCYDGNTKMGTFSWDDPWKSGATNTWSFTPASADYAGITSGGNATGTDIGEVTLTLLLLLTVPGAGRQSVGQLQRSSPSVANARRSASMATFTLAGWASRRGVTA